MAGESASVSVLGRSVRRHGQGGRDVRPYGTAGPAPAAAEARVDGCPAAHQSSTVESMVSANGDGEEEVGGHRPRPEALAAVLACRARRSTTAKSPIIPAQQAAPPPRISPFARGQLRRRPRAAVHGACRGRLPGSEGWTASEMLARGWTVLETPSTPGGPSVRQMKHERPQIDRGLRQRLGRPPQLTPRT